MRIHTIVLALGAVAGLSACGTPTTSTERGIGGALLGAAIADATDENLVAGAALGGIAGAASCGLPGLTPCVQY